MREGTEIFPKFLFQCTGWALHTRPAMFAQNRKVLRSAFIAVLLAVTLVVMVGPAQGAGSANVVISQVYGGGGNSGATYKNDFIELFNRGTDPVDLSAWSVQYASSGGSSWSKTNLSGVIQPGHYYLIQEAQGAGGTVSLPAPEATGTIAMCGTAGKVALVASQTNLSGSCPAAVDFVGFGTAATCFEGSGPTATLSNTTAALRAGNGCVDTDNNNADFATGAPNPRNSASPATTCAAPTSPSILSATSFPSSGEVGINVTLQVTVAPGLNPTSTGLTVTGDLSAIGGSTTETFYDDGTHGDVIAADNVFTLNFSTAGASAGVYSLPVTASDNQLRTGNGNISLTLTLPVQEYAIHDIQGTSDTSPLNGQTVKTRGIVTGVVSNGLYLEAPDEKQDGNDATSEGLFVFGSAPGVVKGDEVQVTGKVQEYQPSGSPLSTTELTSPGFTILSHGNAMPTTIDIAPSPTKPIDQLERYEGMLVHIANPVVTAPTGIKGSASDGVFYVVSGTARPFREPGLAPGAPAISGMPAGVPLFDGNPERVRVDSSQLSTAATISTFDTIGDLTGPLTYANGDFTIVPIGFSNMSTATVTPLAPRADREFTIATFNMLNFTSDPNRIAKASMAIRNVVQMPDIIGVEEVDTQATLDQLTARINSDAAGAGQGTPEYAGVLLSPSGTQNVGFLYRGDRLKDVSIVEIGRDATFTDPRNGNQALLNDRPPLVMTAKLLPPVGQPFPITVIVNHLRSLIDVDANSSTGDFVRAKRRAQAEYLANLIAAHQGAGEQVISVGDYNAFEFNDGYVDVLGTVKGVPTPATEVLLASADLVDPDMVDMVTTLPPAKRYSYVENGNAQTIDHIVASAGLLSRPYHLEIAHNSADFPATYGNNPTRPERVSDHDIPVAYFTFPPPTADLQITMNGSPVLLSGAQQTYTISVKNAGPDAAVSATFLDVLPAQMTFLSLTAPAGWMCTAPAVGSTGNVSCTNTSLAADAEAQFTLNTVVACATANGVQMLNSAGVTSDTVDPDTANNTASQQLTVSNPPPVINGLTVDTPVLWAPNHKMVTVTLGYNVSDNCDVGLIPAVVVSSNQNPATAAAPHSVDWTVVDATHVMLRAERTPPGDRIYTINLTATDSAGYTGTAAVHVTVPQSQGK